MRQNKLIELYMRWSYWFSKWDTGKLMVYRFTSFTDFIGTMKQIGILAAENYLSDGGRGLINRIEPPAIAAEDYVGDCDDFASYCVYFGDPFNPYLYTFFGNNGRRIVAHTVPIFKFGGKIWIIDWSRSYCVDSLEELGARFEELYDINVFSEHLAKFNYTLGRYESVKKAT